eukprot:CAMPEP_0196179548 /NCGR_PEP_ID=MMETSP0911-20130528/21141_1 /TAXON_ID=49265 /ORGANISM="Thalassiosira rotula, Strain GSO102" /LENGTH=44 /DNA_ID= /DNA_START= /DNA_END= /DNA_ORIENTATION=
MTNVIILALRTLLELEPVGVAVTLAESVSFRVSVSAGMTGVLAS